MNQQARMDDFRHQGFLVYQFLCPQARHHSDIICISCNSKIVLVFYNCAGHTEIFDNEKIASNVFITKLKLNY